VLLPVVLLALLATVVRQLTFATALELLAGVGLPYSTCRALAFGELVVDDADGHESDWVGYLSRRPVVHALVEP